MKFIIRTRAETYFNILKIYIYIYIFFNFGFTGFAFKDPRNFQTVKGKRKIENTRELEYSSHISHIDSSLWFSVLFFFFFTLLSYNFQQLNFFGYLLFLSIFTAFVHQYTLKFTTFMWFFHFFFVGFLLSEWFEGLWFMWKIEDFFWVWLERKSGKWGSYNFCATDAR